VLRLRRPRLGLAFGNTAMSSAASHAHAFYRQVAKERRVWTVRDAGGFPAPKNRQGTRSQPFWSSLTRVQKIISTVPAYEHFEPFEVTWEEFRDRWVPKLKRDGLLVGVNWSGAYARGYDIDSAFVRQAVEIQMQALSAEPGASPNGGPAERVGKSEVGGGPPSVS